MAIFFLLERNQFHLLFVTSKKWRTLGSGRRPGCKSSWPSPKACSSSFIFPNGAYLHCSYETMAWMFVSMNRWMDALYDCMYLTTSTNVDTWTRDWNSTFRKFDNRTALRKIIDSPRCSHYVLLALVKTFVQQHSHLCH